MRTIDGTTGTSAGDFRMAFDTSGKLTSVSKLDATGAVVSTTTDGTVGLTLNVGGANGAVANQPINLSMLGSLQQNTGATNFGSPTQDGYAPGDLTSYAINDDGTITGSYSNQKTQLLGQIVLSSFSNPEGLQSKGDNVWQASSASGQAAIWSG